MASRARLRAAVFVAAFALALAVLLLPEEFEHYRRLLDLPRDAALRLSASAALFGKTLAALGLAALPGVALAWCGRSGWARLAGVLVPAAVALYLLVDLEVHRATGDHIFAFGAYLGDAGVWHWAGRGLDVGTPLRAGAGLAAAVAAGAGLLGMLAARRPRGAALALSLAWLLGLAGAPLLQRVSAPRFALVPLNEALPWTWHAGFELDERWPLGFQRKVQALYAAHREALYAAKPPAALALASPTHTPDVLLVVLESLRHDALDSQVMPQLSAFAERGLRAGRHFAGSSASEYGMYSLLYGRSALDYYAAQQIDSPPTLVFALRGAGYRAHYLTSGDTRWQRMNRFLGMPHFRAEVFAEGPNWRRDRDLVARARALLAAPSEQPRLVVAYLMSTHWGFDFPPGTERFQPSLPPPNGLDPALVAQRQALANRYRNAAHYLDGLLGPWLAELDLARTLVVVTGDHGEALFDDGTPSHSSRLSEIQTRVPLVMAGVGVPAGQRLDRLSSHADLLPSVLNALGYPQPLVAALPGRDLVSPGAAPVCVPLVKRRKGPREEAALVTPEARFSLRLLHERGRALFLGRLRDDGLLAEADWSLDDAERFLECFADWLRREGTPPPVLISQERRVAEPDDSFTARERMRGLDSR